MVLSSILSTTSFLSFLLLSLSSASVFFFFAFLRDSFFDFMTLALMVGKIAKIRGWTARILRYVQQPLIRRSILQLHDDGSNF